MGNPQVNMLNEGVKSSNSHISGRFAGTGGVSNNNDEHSSTLHSTVNTSTENNGFLGSNNSQQNSELPTLRNNKFVKEDVVVSNTSIANDNKKDPATEYLNDPTVRANLDKKNEVNQLIDVKTMMVLGLVVMIFIFILPFIFDILN